MNQLPDTRHTLLIRLQQAEDQQAWREFLEIYEPVVYRLARHRGLQHADALDVTQDVLASVATAIDRWDPDPAQGRFRGWLFTIARNLIVDALVVKSHRPRGSGQTTIQQLLEQQPAVEEQEASVCEWEYQRATFQWAAEQIRGEFQEKTWQAFWQTGVGNEPIPDTAARLGLSVGAVYAARSRVLARLRKKIEQLEDRRDAR
jgi:RNA polymerase sigma factor (sigma-70 family)